jgi:hypothetical protein
MGLPLRKVHRWLWSNKINANGYHKFNVWVTPFGTYWLLRWGYWTGGFFQFFSLGKFYLRNRKRIKI